MKKNKNEEAFKIDWLLNHPEFKDARPFLNFDLDFKDCVIFEFKKDDNELPENLICQAIIACANKHITYRWAVSVQPSFEYYSDITRIDLKALASIGAIPSSRDDVWRQAKNSIIPYLDIKRGLPTIIEIERVSKGYYYWDKNPYKWNLKSIEENKIFIGFDKEKQEIYETMRENTWAAKTEKERFKRGAYYTPENYEKAAKELITRTWGSNFSAYDPCSGDGRLVEDLTDEVYTSDLENIPGITRSNHDFFKQRKIWLPSTNRELILITNPPFNRIKELFDIMNSDLKRKKWASFLKLSSIPFKPQKCVGGFYMHSHNWPGLPENGDGFGIAFLLFDPDKPDVDEILIKDIDTQEDKIIEFTPPQDALLLNNKPWRYNAQYWGYQKKKNGFIGKTVRDIDPCKFVKQSQIINIDYNDGKKHYQTNTFTGESKAIIGPIQPGWEPGRKQNISEKRKKIKEENLKENPKKSSKKKKEKTNYIGNSFGPLFIS